MKTAEVEFVDDGPGKPVGINRFIGRRPIFAFGNSDGDLQMLQWTAAGDAARASWASSTTPTPSANTPTTGKPMSARLDKALDEGRARGWSFADMKRDWRVIFPAESTVGGSRDSNDRAKEAKEPKEEQVRKSKRCDMTAGTYVKRGVRELALAIVLLVAGLTSAAAQAQQTAGNLNNQQIEQLVAPIALFPDSLVSQVLMASTYPLEVVEAARWAQENPKVTGQALEDAMQKQPWDPSVKALTAVPQTLTMMNDQLKWTQDLGDAFLAQQSDVLDAVQRLRARADAAGNLKSTPQQTVTRTNRPANVAAGSGAPATAYTIAATQSGRVLRADLRSDRDLRCLAV